MEDHSPSLLRLRLHRHEAHGGTRGRLADCLRIGRVVLVALDERFHVDRRDQFHLVAELPDLPAPMMRARAGLHRHHAGRLRRQKWHDLGPRQLPAERNGSVRMRSMRLKTVLREINPDDANLFHGRLLLQGVECDTTLAHRDAVGGRRPSHRPRRPQVSDTCRSRTRLSRGPPNIERRGWCG